jgi:hypothetical protein
MLIKEMKRPAKNKKTDMWSRAGMASTVRGRWKRETPSAKYERMKARLWIARWGWVRRRYRRAQRCWSVARRAQKRLMTRLRNQSALIQTAEAGGCQSVWDKEGPETLLARVPLARPSSCWDIWARRMTVFAAESGNKDL